MCNPARLTWQKAVASSTNDGCLEVAYVKATASGNSSNGNSNCVEAGLGACGSVHVRDSHRPQRVIDVPPADMLLFFQGVKDGDFDRLMRMLDVA